MSYTAPTLAYGEYIWRVRTIDTDGATSAWTTSTTNCVISDNNPPNLPILDNYNSGETVTTSSVTLQFDLSDPDAGDQVKYQIQVDNDADFSSPLEDDATDTLANSPRDDEAFAVSGLTNGTWYWRVKAFDAGDLESDWATAATGFVVNIPVDNSSSSSSSSSGGGGGGSSSGGAGSIKTDPCSNESTPYLMPGFKSSSKVKLRRPLDLSYSEGKINRPIEIKNCRYEHFALFREDTLASDETGEQFNRIIAVPNEINVPINTQIRNGYEVLKGIEIGAADNSDLSFSQDYTLRIYLDEAEERDADKIKIYYYDTDTNTYKLAGDGGNLSSGGTYIETEVGHMTIFAVMYVDDSSDGGSDDDDTGGGSDDD